MKLLKKNRDILFVFLISLLPLLTLFTPGLPVTHDGQDHVARIANFYASLSEGNIIPRWAANLNWGYGHPILMFLYPLPSYVASLFHFTGFSLVDSIKIVFALTFILSGIFMYIWVRNVLGIFPGLIAAILYLYAPYRFVDLYVRGAIGEHVAFVFPPLILYFMHKLYIGKSTELYITGIVLSMGALILSHNAISLMFLPFIIFYALYLWFQNRNLKVLIFTFISLLYGFLVSAFFWIPAFVEGKYTLRDIVTGNEALSRFVQFQDLLWGPWNYGGTGVFTVQLGIIQWIFIVLSPIGIYLAFKRGKSLHLLYIATLLYLVASIFIMLPYSEPIWKFITTLQKFQFPWRFLSISVFTSALLGGLFLSYTRKKSLKIVILLIVLIFSIILTKDYWKPKDFSQRPEEYYNSIYEGTTDTGESAPRWSVRFMEQKPNSSMEVIEGDAEIYIEERTTTLHSYVVDSNSSSRVVENTLYFPGWKVYINGQEYKGIQYQDPDYRGLMTFKVLNGKNKVDVIFEDTRLRQVSNLISLGSIIGIASFLLLVKVKRIKLL